MTDAERWLRERRDAVLLVDVDYMYQVGVGTSAVPTLGTKKFSTGPYPGYKECVISVPSFDRAVDRETLRGRYLPRVGEVVIRNHDRAQDSILALALDGSEVRVSIADPTGEFPDVIELYRANALLVNAPNRGRLSITLRDAGVLINKTIGGDVEVGGAGPSANEFRPFNFGWVHQVEPILYDSGVGGGQYVHSDTGTATAAVAVRNDGVSVAFTDNGDGTFTLTTQPAGNEKITCDVVATLSGGTDIGYRFSDLMNEMIGNRAGLTALGRYDGALNDWIVERTNDYPCQLSIRGKQKIMDVLDFVLDTLNGFYAFTRLGSFFYYGMAPASLEAVIAESAGAITVAAYITTDEITDAKISHNAPKYSSYQCYSNVNQTEQKTFASSLTSDDREQYERIGYASTHFLGEDPGTTSYLGTTPFLGGAPDLYHLTLSDAEVVKTIISGATDAATPAGVSIDGYMETFLALRRALYLPWTEFLDISVGLDRYALELGDIVQVTYDAWGLDSGVLYQVCSIGIDASARKVNLGLVRRRYAGVLDTEGPSYELREDGDFELREDGGFEIRE